MKRQQKQRPHAQALNEPKTTLSQSIKEIKGEIPLEGFDETETECLAEKDINAIVSDKTDPVKRFQGLCKAIFTEEELKFCSPTGKTTTKCGEGGARPPLDRGKLKQLFAIAEQHLQFMTRECPIKI